MLETFYIPVLSRSVTYDRSVGYFRSSSLAVAAKGVSRFIKSGGTIRLLCGAEVTATDRDALLNKRTLDGAFAQRLAASLVTDDEIVRRRLEVLAWLAKERRLKVRIAIPVDASGQPLTTEGQDPYFHEKIGIFRDANGDGIAFQGSVNESATAWTRNFESFSVYTSWDATATHFSFWANKFEDRWNGRIPGFRVYDLPEAARLRLISLAPEQAPDEVDPEEAPGAGDDAVIARFLLEAPRLIGAERLAEATTGVELFPHQRQVVARLADTYPRSWLVADEVGLGKTISAGMSLRRLLLDGRVRKALILAPANVCRQWQDELFEKFGLWVPRLDGNKIYGVHPSDVRRLPKDANPYAEHPVLIASSHLARRIEHHDMLLAAGPYDLIIVDEAHHARRTHFHDDDYRPGRLLQLLDKITQSGAATAKWLLTATPMQVDPVELRDLLMPPPSGTIGSPDYGWNPQQETCNRIREPQCRGTADAIASGTEATLNPAKLVQAWV
ncbi:SNF2-related protein [uncultured Thermomonospora sp.]|uniref:SNF2-related protein n=1 Tax=uncultured Thermomonospora sp. TaxID=671175 RepID=UPI00259B1069|nr:SNF2-related protein [uncultured Thermomonospora sp.]